jgi:hypothetical protein
MIDAGNVIVACVSTGLCTLWAGWAGFFGSVVGQIIYYAWLKDILFG